MPVHRVLVETEKQVYAVAVGEHLLIANADRQQDVSAADDRLIGVVRIEVQTTTAEHASEDVARRRDPLAGGSTDGDAEVETVSWFPPDDGAEALGYGGVLDDDVDEVVGLGFEQSITRLIF